MHLRFFNFEKSLYVRRGVSHGVNIYIYMVFIGAREEIPQWEETVRLRAVQ